MKLKINYARHYIDKKDLKSVEKSLNSNFLSQGPETIKFEKALNNFFGSKYTSVVSSGTAALHLIGKALDWKKGDTIITTPLTFAATANAICYSGAIPQFVDIDSQTYNIDLNQLEDKIKKINKFRKKVKAVVAVDYAGNPCDWRSLRYLANKYKLKLINDNCHALGAKYLNDKSYAVKYADVVSQSFQSLKNITTGEGGAIITNDKKIFDKVKILRSHGIVNYTNKKKNNHWKNKMNDLGFNYRMTDFQSTLGLSQLRKINFFIKKRAQIASYYDYHFSGIENFVIPKVNKNNTHAYHLYPLQIDFKKIKKNRDKMLEYFLNKNFRLQIHYTPIYHYNYYKKLYNYKKKSFPNTENFYSKEVSIPIFPGLKERDQLKFINLLKKYLFN